MLPDRVLKNWLHGNLTRKGKPLSRGEKLLLILFDIGKPCQIDDLKTRGKQAGFTIKDSWNPSEMLRRLKGKAIRADKRWEILDAGKDYLRDLGVPIDAPPLAETATTLRSQLGKIPNAMTREFVDEAIKCCEYGLHRSAIVMSWLTAIDVLRHYVFTHANHRKAFDQAMKARKKDWEPAEMVSDYGNVPDAAFLLVLREISVIPDDDVAAQLKLRLGLRNSCGHPNQLSVDPDTVKSHIGFLIRNVFARFS